MPHFSRRSAALLVVIGVTLIGAAAVWFAVVSGSKTLPTAAGSVPPASFTSASVAVPPPPAATSRSTKPKKHNSAKPLRLKLAAIAADAPVVPVTVTAGSLGVPDDPKTLGWWSSSARPGSTVGSVVIDGHVDSEQRGRGTLFQLAEVNVGAAVSVRTASGTVNYRVTGRRIYDKSILPADVFALKGPPRLVLITCGGPFNTATRHYRDNVVVYAVPVV
jgi:hypothetical protein